MLGLTEMLTRGYRFSLFSGEKQRNSLVKPIDFDIDRFTIGLN